MINTINYFVKNIGILIFEGVQELDFVGAYDVLKCEKKINPKSDLRVEIIAKEAEVRCFNDLKVIPHKRYDNFDNYDAIIIPGGEGRKEVIQQTTR